MTERYLAAELMGRVKDLSGPLQEFLGKLPQSLQPEKRMLYPNALQLSEFDNESWDNFENEPFDNSGFDNEPPWGGEWDNVYNK